MKDILKKVLKFAIFLILGIFLFWFVYKDQPIKEIKEAILDANFFWLILSMIIGLISHIFRALRWQMFMTPLNYKPSFTNSYHAVMVGYFANLAIPRMGEVTRCAVIKKYEKIPLTQSLGTILVERVIDLIILGLLTLVVLFTRYSVLVELLNKPEIKDKLSNFGGLTTIILIGLFCGALALLAIFIYRRKLQHNKIYQKIIEIVDSIVSGIKSIKQIKGKLLFIVYSLLIWVSYFAMLYVCFFSLESTSELGLLTGLTMFVMGSYGMIAPVQGGIGAWHFMVSTVLIINGLSEVNSLAFAFIAHGFQTLLLVIGGIISLILLPLTNRS